MCQAKGSVERRGAGASGQGAASTGPSAFSCIGIRMEYLAVHMCVSAQLVSDLTI